MKFTKTLGLQNSVMVVALIIQLFAAWFVQPPLQASTVNINYFPKNGQIPFLFKGSDGDLFSAYFSAPSNGQVTTDIYALTGPGSFTYLTSFVTNGTPNVLIRDANGTYYGAIQGDGQVSYGSLFKVSPTGTTTTLVNFNGSNGSMPNTLFFGSDGYLYGSTTSGGAYFQLSVNSNIYGYGTIFKISTSGGLSRLYSFTSTQGSLYYPIVRAGDGNFYGVTPNGGTAHAGSLFRVTPGGAYVTLASFGTSAGSPRTPEAPLTVGSNGILYGTAILGGSGYGGIFQYSISANTLYFTPFNGTQGGASYSTLFEGDDGNLYGNTAYSGTNQTGSGVVFQYNPNGTVTYLFTLPLSPTDFGSIVQGPDEAFYGVVDSNAAGGDAQFYAFAFPQAQSIALPSTGTAKVGDTLSLPALSSANLPITYSLLSGTATLSGTSVTFTAAGNVVISASQPGNLFYSAAPTVTLTETVTPVSKSPQAISFPAPGSQPYGVLFSPGASSTSGLPITYSVVSGPATIVGNKVSFTGLGSVVVQANQAGNSSYLPAPLVQATIKVVKGSQTITAPKIANQVVGASPITLNATASSGLAVTYKVTGPAVLSGNVLTITGAGSVAVGCYQAGNTLYAAAPSVQIKFTVAKLTQTLTFPSPGTATVGQTVTLGATASSGLPVTYAVSSSAATISGNQITFLAKGTVRVTATQPGNATYTAARAVNVNILVK